MAGFKREKRSLETGERETRVFRDERSRASNYEAEKRYAFTNIGSIKQGRGMSDKDAAQIKGCEESIKLKLYMPGVIDIKLANKAIIGIKLGQRSGDENFVLAQAFLPLGSVTPTKKTDEHFQAFLKDFGNIPHFDLVADIYLPKGQEEVTLYSGQTLILTFKTGEKAQDIDYVLGTLSIANDAGQ